MLQYCDGLTVGFRRGANLKAILFYEVRAKGRSFGLRLTVRCAEWPTVDLWRARAIPESTHVLGETLLV